MTVFPDTPPQDSVPVWSRDEVQSPCVNVCVLDRVSGYCLGCLRTGAEIAAWSAMTNDARHALRAVLPDREDAVRAARLARRGGRRRARTARSETP